MCKTVIVILGCVNKVDLILKYGSFELINQANTL